MMFWCTPAGNCERHQLLGLVVRYNDLFEKSYAISACLDVENRDEPEPELLLEAPGETSIVIEHKTVAWPKRYHREHHNEHVIADDLHALLDESYQDDFYVLTLWAKSLAGQRTLYVKHWAQQIADTVSFDEPNSKSVGGIHGLIPIPWNFRPADEFDRNYDSPDTGIEVRIFEDSPPLLDPSGWLESEAEAVRGYKSELERLATNCEAKFAKYANCLRVLALQFYGYVWSLSEHGIADAINSAELPDCIDQVWLGQPDWIDEANCVTGWDLIRTKTPR